MANPIIAKNKTTLKPTTKNWAFNVYQFSYSRVFIASQLKQQKQWSRRRRNNKKCGSMSKGKKQNINTCHASSYQFFFFNLT